MKIAVKHSNQKHITVTEYLDDNVLFTNIMKFYVKIQCAFFQHRILLQMLVYCMLILITMTAVP